MADVKFLGFKQVTKSFYDSMTDSEKKGYLFLVREFAENERQEQVLVSSALYFGTRKYAETNDVSAMAAVNEKVDSIIEALGGSVDEDGNYVGFLPFTGDTHAILSDTGITTISEALEALEAAVMDKVDSDDFEAFQNDVEAQFSALTADVEDLDNRVESLEGKISGVWHFKGKLDTIEELDEVENPENGDVWQVGESEYAWNGTEWVYLGEAADFSEINGRLTRLEERVDNLEEKATMVVPTYEDAISAATAESLGAIIYTTTTTYSYLDDGGEVVYVTDESEIPEGKEHTTYDAGAYIVTGEGSVQKLAQTSASGDVSADIAELRADLDALKQEEDNVHTISGNDVEE